MLYSKQIFTTIIKSGHSFEGKMLGYSLKSGQSKRMLKLYAIGGIILSIASVIATNLMSRHFAELSWQNPVELSMLSWTCGFLKLFIAILLAESCRSSKIRFFAIISCIFLITGLSDFVYSLSFPGSNRAVWIKIITLLIASFFSFFVLSDRFKKEAQFWKICLNTFFPATALWIALFVFLNKIDQFLPSAILPNGISISQFAKFVLGATCGIFLITFIGSMFKALEDDTGEFKYFPAVFFSFAIIAYLLRASRVWDIIWWSAHILECVLCFAYSIFWLSHSMRKSLIWRLIFSVSFLFGLAILIASSITQAIFEKKTESEYRRILHARHLKQIFKYRMMLEKPNCLLRLMIESKENVIKSYIALPTEITKIQSQKYFKKITAFNDKIIEVGVFDGNVATYYGKCKINSDKKNEILRECFSEIQRRKEKNDFICWNKPIFLQNENQYVAFAGVEICVNDKANILYTINDISEVILPEMLANKSSNTKYSGRILIDAKSGKTLSELFPAKFLNDEYNNSESAPLSQFLKNELSRIITSTAIASRADGLSFVVNFNGRSFTIFSTLLPETGWILADMLDNEALSIVYKKHPAKYIIMAAGMVSLLIGIIIFIVLLEIQIGNPLRKIIDATRTLDKGDFQIRINSNLENELGILSNSFDNMAEHLQQSYEELKNLVKERTLAYNELEKAASEKSHFFTLLSHELKTPLHAILSFSRLGQNKAKDAEKVKDYFNNINESGQRLLSIVDEMLESAKIKSGQVEYSFSKSSLFLLVLQVAEEMKACFEEKNIKFVCQPPKFSTAAIFDREKIGRVIRNIISNAVKLSPKKSTIEVLFSNQNPQMISVEIRDKGPGIPPADINKIFDEFFQSETGKKIGGTGLGLHICKIIVEKHNGTIYAKNNPDGKGACIGFSIPIFNQLPRNDEKKQNTDC